MLSKLPRASGGIQTQIRLPHGRLLGPEKAGSTLCMYGAWSGEGILGWSFVRVPTEQGLGPLRVSSVSLCLHSILQDVTLTPISLCLSGDHPHSPARRIFSLLRTGLHFPKCVIWGTRDGILGEKVFLLIVT